MEKEERQDHGVDGALGGLNPTCIKVGEAQDLWGGGGGENGAYTEFLKGIK